MKVNMQGCTRIVLEFKNVVVKVPNFSYSWEHFIKGIIANISESKTWKYNSGRYNYGLEHLLCPMLFSSWGGWFIVMKKAKVLTEDQYLDLDTSLHQLHFGGDDKANSYGIINTTIVKIDYGQ